MTHFRLTLACEDYDRTRPIKDGIVNPDGIEVNYLTMSVEEIFWRMMKYEEFDASELSMGAFLTAAARRRAPGRITTGMATWISSSQMAPVALWKRTSFIGTTAAALSPGSPPVLW